MTAAESDEQTTRADRVWTAGQVAQLLGVSPVTLRSWTARYGVAPRAHQPGRHRRYTAQDLRTLRAMCDLIDAGMPAKEAARLSLNRPDTPTDLRPPHTEADLTRELTQTTEQLDEQRLFRLIQLCVHQHGILAAWQQHLAPMVRGYGQRWLDKGDCIDIETILADTIFTALTEDISEPRTRTTEQPPVLLGCCTGERHILPLTVLRRALRDAEIPVALITGGIPAAATLGAADRLDPAVVVLFSLARETADASLMRALENRPSRVLLAGPGWPPDLRRRRKWANNLPRALDTVTDMIHDARRHDTAQR